MQTPLGPLVEFDLSDYETCRRILAFDKHQLIEGLVFENYFDQYLRSLPQASEESMNPVDVDTAVVALPAKDERTGADSGAFVWARRRDVGLGRYLEALSGKMPVWLVEYNEADGDFMASPVDGSQPRRPWKPLQEIAASVSNRHVPDFEEVAPEVRDRNRINQSFWGYLSERHGSGLADSVVLPRIFLNWGVQPWFRYVWNVDRVYLHEGQLWHLEIKHKYPMERRDGLAFGINDGELRLIRRFGDCGLRTFHAVIVKPFWDKSVGSMYLLNDPNARARAAVVGREITSQNVNAALSSHRGSSGDHTTFTGRGRLGFRTFPVSSFHQFGCLADDHTEVARRIFSQMTRQDQPGCRDADLRDLRLESDNA